MKVILTQDVRGQGKRGQMIEVSDGYARNFLLPRKLAQEATADNVSRSRLSACTRSSASSAMRSMPTSRSRSRRAKQALIF